ncbi:MAG: carboxypeptidase regulatory-like domain-containing protein [Ideonella sp. MAG2]|nr:MAG: carboxypeptidase regulatory-like domain-containing protein [Ideonella sp. MAG2]
MSYLLKGLLQGALCHDCVETLEGVVVRAYAVEPRVNVTALAVARSKDTFEQLSPEQVKAKAPRLLAEARVDAQGQYALDFGRQKAYEGQAIELDIFCTTVPRRKSELELPPPMQFSITTVQPQWRALDQFQVAVWDHTLPYRTWCAVRGLFGAWVVCGQVRHCETQAPLAGLKVRAFDVDWLQDDALGEGLTDSSGRFRIDYLASDFARTIFSPSINLEWTGGPDLYFRVETALGTVLLSEPAARGRAPDRENAGPCFCIDLCVDQQPPSTEDISAFVAIGQYFYATDIDSALGGSGLTTGDQRAFHRSLRLNGVLAKTLNGQALEYRFEYRHTSANGTPTGPWTPIQPTEFGSTYIGTLERLDLTDPSGEYKIKAHRVYADPASPGADDSHAAIVDGWIRVPQASNALGPEGSFIPNGNMLMLLTDKLLPQPALTMAGVLAGESSTAHGAALAQNQHIGLRMRVRAVGRPSTELNANTCAHLAIENTVYQRVRKGGSWSPSVVDGQLCACSVDTLELRSAGGCSGLNNSLTVLYTAAHPNLGQVSLSMKGPGGDLGFTLAASPNLQDRFGQASNGNPPGSWAYADLPDCAYIVTLSAQLLLTTGDSVPDPVMDQLAFCKKG